MLKSKESLEVEYLGGEKLQISEYENKMCNFYLIKKFQIKVKIIVLKVMIILLQKNLEELEDIEVYPMINVK